jgi:Flp pilus assembly protein TadD
MLSATGNPVGARALVEEVLASDPSHVAALKMKAAWLIAEDKPGDAIVALRTAQDQDPKDPEIRTLTGQAHEREGARDLAGQSYADAVEVSGRGVPESLRYAGFLIQDNRLDSALSVLQNGLQAHPRDAALLRARADLLIRMRNWADATDAVAALRALGTPQAIDDANRLQASLLLRQEKISDTIAFLDSLSKGASTSSAAVAAVVQAQVQAGQIDAARDYVDGLLAKTPDDRDLRYLRADIHLVQDQPDQAEAIYRALMAEKPDDLRPFQALYKMLLANDRAADATALLAEELKSFPDSPMLNLMQAGELEKNHDIDGAIAIYEKLYARDSSSQIVANNLASLLVSYRDDAASLDRAFAIAARLRGSTVPAFQDTYGWIEYRRGDYEAALADLEPAARGLPKDPMVQMHLGLTYAALKRTEDARATLTRALELAGDPAPAVFDAAKTALADLGGPPGP